MNIKEALEKTGMAWQKHSPSTYVKLDSDNVLQCYNADSNSHHCAVIMQRIIDDNWLPYEPEGKKKIKCEYCRRADHINSGITETAPEWVRAVNNVYAGHLRTDHCICGERNG